MVAQSQEQVIQRQSIELGTLRDELAQVRAVYMKIVTKIELADKTEIGMG